MRFLRWIASALLVWGLAGCAASRHGIIDERTFYSVENPNIRIDVADGFEWNKESDRSNRYIFVNMEEHRLVQIDYLHQSFKLKQRADHYYNPLGWIFYDIPNSKELDKGETEIMDQRWYYRDLVHHNSTASCALVRDLGYFTDDKDVLKVIYAQDLPPYECARWKDIETLDANQRRRVRHFLDNLASDIRISTYTPDPAPQ